MGVKRRLGLIGVGKMGEALLKGLLSSKQFTQERIVVSDKDPSRLAYIREEYGVVAKAKSREVIREVNPCIVAVKPQDMDHALEDMRDGFPESCVLISIAAGITTEWIQSRLGRATKVVRAMPNAPAVVGMAATGIFLGSSVSPEEGKVAQAIFDSVGRTILVDTEDHLNIVTGLSGSGPGYIFLLLEALTDAGVYLGLSRDVAAGLSLQTIRGSAQMAAEAGRPVPLLKEIITSPGGTTVAGLKVLEEGKIRATILSAVEAATKRSRELAR